jgi:hypothetical protein
MAFALSHSVSDHVPYVIQMESLVPKSNIFRFENYWVSFLDFLPIVEYFWNLPSHRENQGLVFSTKLKTLKERFRRME